MEILLQQQQLKVGSRGEIHLPQNLKFCPNETLQLINVGKIIILKQLDTKNFENKAQYTQYKKKQLIYNILNNTIITYKLNKA